MSGLSRTRVPLLTRILRPLLAPIVVLLAHTLSLSALVQLDVVGRLLGAAATPPIVLLGVVGAFYVLRLGAFFVVPGWLLCRMFAIVSELIAERR